jgi:hypothetical protein
MGQSDSDKPVLAIGVEHAASNDMYSLSQVK